MKSQQSMFEHKPYVNCELPLVSVIIPVFNVAPYLREALDSVVNQTYHHLEIIIVDDDSNDGSGLICDEYCSDPRVQVIHQAHRGVANARNTGLDRATGDYIAFLDPDDAYHPDFIRQMLEAIKGADIAVCQYEIHQLTLDSRGWSALTAKAGFYDRKKALRALVDHTFNIGVVNKLYRKDLWEHIRFPNGQNYEDVITTCRVFDLCNRLYFLDQSLYLRRIRPGSITQTISKKNSLDRSLSYDQRVAFVEAHYPEVFSKKDIIKMRQARLSAKIVAYAKGYMDTSEIQAVCKDVDAEGYSFRSQVAYHMIRFCPWLLKAIYSIYQPLRRLARKLFQR